MCALFEMTSTLLLRVTRAASSAVAHHILVRPHHVRAIIIFLLFARTAAVAQMPTLQPLPTIPVPAAGPPRPTYDEFFSRINYPYRAAPEQRRRIERAGRVVRIGWTEPQILKLLGPPDYKAKWLHDVGRGSRKRTVLDEYWHYIHSMDEPSRYDAPGRLFIIGLSNGSKPRRVIQVDGVDIPGLKPQGVPEV